MTFLLRRLLHVLAVVIVSTSLGFVVLHVVPGDPLGSSTEKSGRSEEARAELNARYGLDRPLTEQYAAFAARTVRADWGNSIVNGQPVGQTLRDGFLNTLKLTGAGLLLAIVIGVALGAWQGWKPKSLAGRALGGILTSLYVIPEFLLAIVLIAVFSYQLALFPIGGTMDPIVGVVGTPTERLRDQLWHLVLPALTLGIGWGAAVARQQRNSLSEVRREEFVRTANAKGVSPRQVFLRHAFPVALPPVIAVIGLMLPVLVGGAVVVETVFAWPGLGSLLLRSISARDYPIVSGAIVLTGFFVAVSTILTDAALYVINPRLRSGSH